MTQANPARTAQVRDLIARSRRLHEKGKPDQALRALDTALALDRADARLHRLRGDVLLAVGQGGPAMESYDRALALDPGEAEALEGKGVLLAIAGFMEPALRAFDRAVELAPERVSAHNNRALALKALGRVEEALAAFEAVLVRAPDRAITWFDRGLLLAETGRHDAALAAFERTLRLDPGHLDALCNRATALSKLERIDEAIDGFGMVLARQPGHLAALVNLGEMLGAVRRYEEAEFCYRDALALQPDMGEVYQKLGLVLARQHRYAEAVQCYQAAVQHDHRRIATLEGMAQTLYHAGRRHEALEVIDRLDALSPDSARLAQQRGILYFFMQRYKDAIASFERAAALDPTCAQPSLRLHASMREADWAGFDRLVASLPEQTLARPVQEPDLFPVLALTDDPAFHRDLATRLVAQRRPAPPIPAHPRRDRIRIGYFSSDYQYHATLHLFADALEAHDRDRFEIIGVSLAKPVDDAWRARAEAACDRFVDVHGVTDREAARIVRALEIDIAVDLKGYTLNNRFGLFLERVAPVQVAYLGYPGTSGASCIDYILADAVVIPETHHGYYTERVVTLPGCYQPNAPLRPLAGLATRADEGLPEDAIVYCSFNQVHKITPPVFEQWMAVLRAVEGSVLWLWVPEEDARANLRREAAARGVAADRLCFAMSAPLEYHLDRLRLADLFLDTFPYTAHTTASDSIRAGVPLVTCPGDSFASRVAASLLTAIDMPELIASDHAAYRALAIALGADRARLSALRAKLADRRDRSSVFDPVGAARKLEAAYRAMYDISQRGEAARPIALPA